MESNDTFRHSPAGDAVINDHPALSAPIGTRGILAEVRAAHPLKCVLSANTTLANSPSQQGLDDLFATGAASAVTTNKYISLSARTGRSIGGTMSKGGAGTKITAQVDHLAWIASVRQVESKRGSSSGGGSRGGERSSAPSRLGSGSRPPAVPDRGVSENDSRQKSESLDRQGIERKEGDGNQWLQDECVKFLYSVAIENLKITQDYDRVE
jgi:hypothetical protein